MRESDRRQVRNTKTRECMCNRCDLASSVRGTVRSESGVELTTSDFPSANTTNYANEKLAIR